MNRYKSPPKASVLSYFLPFLIILFLIGAGFVIVTKQISIDDIRSLLRSPKEIPQKKISLVYSEEELSFKPWSKQDWSPLSVSQELHPGDSVKTLASGLAVFRFFDESEIRLGESTEVKFIRMDTASDTGDHILIELLYGKLWRRGKDPPFPGSDFVINTQQQSLVMSKAAVVDLSTGPETIRVLAGTATSNVIEKKSGTRLPVGKIDLVAGQELVVGKNLVATVLSAEYLNGEWYQWNREKEDRLGELAPFFSTGEPPKEDLEKLEEGFVMVNTPKNNQKTGSRVMVGGTFNPEKIEKVLVNRNLATLGLGGEWEYRLTPTDGSFEITVTAIEKLVSVEKLVQKISLQVDASGPVLGKILQPEVDDNLNGALSSDKLELIGEVAPDAIKVCVSHNDDEPYCLKEFKKGNKTYKYLGAVKYGNVIKGKNKYTITAYDEWDNGTNNVVYLFKDIPKPESRIETSKEPEIPPSQPELGKPVIESPDPGVTLETREQSLLVFGKLDKRTDTLLVNGKKAPYQPGSEDFSVTLELEEGENLIKLQSVDRNGNKSKVSVLTAIYISLSTPDAEDAQ